MNVPIYETLYKINKNGQISSWHIEIIPSNDGQMYTVVTKHGLIDGKQNVHEHAITEGKAKKTVLEQATQFANRKWTDKKDKELFTTDPSPHSLSNSLSHSLSHNSSMSVRPMLAKTWTFPVSFPFPAYVQIKYDGLRCISRLKEGAAYMESRTGSPFIHFLQLKDEITQLLSQHGLILDGELFTDQIPFEEINGLCRLKTVPKDMAPLLNKIEYHIYDCIDTARPQLGFEERMRLLENIFSASPTVMLCKRVNTYPVTNANEVKTFHDRFVQQGHEGVMIRTKEGPYEINKRSAHLQKYKEFDEDEFEIVGFHEGTGDEQGLVLWNCITKDGKPFSVRPKGTFVLRRQLFLDAGQHVGKQLTVKYQGLSEDGVPRFPVGKDIREHY